jgi:membrane-bound lytic murein transglycosylase B
MKIAQNLTAPALLLGFLLCPPVKAADDMLPGAEKSAVSAVSEKPAQGRASQAAQNGESALQAAPGRDFRNPATAPDRNGYPGNQAAQNGDRTSGGAPDRGPAACPSTFDPAFAPLLDRLAADGFSRAYIEVLFARLGPRAYTPAYMSLKLQELFGAAGIGVNRGDAPKPEPPDGFTLPLKEFTVGDCLEFVTQQDAMLQAVEKRYGVRRSVLLSLMLVETAMGRDLGRDIALRALAGMAQTIGAAELASGGNARQARSINAARLADTLRKRSERAYRELVALLRWCRATGLDASRIPGSIYGAVGLCQFMPSNIEPYGVDGDGDGKINLYSPADAAHSAARYLEAHGWRGAATDAQRHKVLMAYNDDGFYASFVLGAAKRMERALAGKISPQSAALPGFGVPSARLNPSLRRLRPVPARAVVRALGDYKSLLP